MGTKIFEYNNAKIHISWTFESNNLGQNIVQKIKGIFEGDSKTLNQPSSSENNAWSYQVFNFFRRNTKSELESESVCVSVNARQADNLHNALCAEVQKIKDSNIAIM